MTILKALILGLIQGLTEFLPVSSKSHLVFANFLMHLRLSPSDTVFFDVMLHWGTLVAVAVFFRKDILQLLRGGWQLLVNRRQAWAENPFSRLFALLLVGTIPAGIVYITLKHFLERAFENVPGTAAMLLVTAGMLYWISRRTPGTRELPTLTWKDAVQVGCFQAFALLPGISRSGSTITGSLLRGMDRETAPRFSFLLAVPVIFAAGLMKMKDVISAHAAPAIPIPALVVGFVAAVISGYVAVGWMLKVVRNGKLSYFAGYCAVLGVGMLLYWTLLVPKVDVARVSGTVDLTSAAGLGTLTWSAQQIDHDGKVLGTLPAGEKWTLQVPVRAGLVPLSHVEFVTADGHPLPMLKTPPLPLAGKGVIGVQFNAFRAISDAAHIGGSGEIRVIWMVLRNRWGIENSVPLRVWVTPETMDIQLS